jgi:hypothetical protein
MESSLEDTAEELEHLRRCLKDLAGLLELPAIRGGGDAAQIARALTGVLPGMLGLDFISVKVNQPPGELPVEVAVGNSNEGGALSTVPLGFRGELGTIVAGARRKDFPRETDRVLLGVAASQATIALQNAEAAQRVRVESALRGSEANLRKIIDALPATAWTTRPDGYCDFLNYRWLAYAGFTAEEAVGWGWAAVIHPDDAEGLRVYWQGCLDAGKPVDTEARMRGADGNYRWFLFRANPFRDEGGNIIKWYGTNIDIEDRKRADEALRASELRLRELTETIPEMLWSATPEGAIDYCNTRFLDYTGMSSQSVMGEGWQKTIHPEDAARAGPIWMSCVATGAPYQVEVRTFHSADQTYRWCTVAALPLLDEHKRILKWHGTAVDIHDRKLVEEKLRQSEQDARMIVDCIPAQVAVLGPTGAVEQINRQMAHFFGKTVESLQEWRTDDIVPPEERPRVNAGMKTSLETGQAFVMENRLRRHDGVYRWFEVRGLPLKDAAGRVLHWYFLLADLEDRKQAEEALDKARSELAHVARSMSLGALTASIAHEVNQPLSGIITNAGTCLRMLAAEPPDLDGARETARRMMRDGHRAADVIVRLRALFSKTSTMAEKVDLNEAAREVISLLSGDLQRSRVIVQAELDGDSMLVTGDRVQLQQVVMNLIRNACDAMSEVHDRPRQLRIKTERDEQDEVKLTVRDAGVGLDPENAQRLFDAFYTTKNEGMGIGLSVSRSIIDRHHGRLWAEANDGPGATFAFSIPRSLPAGVTLRA